MALATLSFLGCLSIPLLAADAQPGTARQPALSAAELASASPAEALGVFEVEFSRTLESLARDPVDLAGVERYLGQRAALLDPSDGLEPQLRERLTQALRSAGGDREQVADAGRLLPETAGRSPPQLLESTLPLRARSDSGRLQPIDLALEEDASGYAPANPLVSLHLPAQANGPIALGDDGLSITLADAQAAPTQPASGDNLFYAESARDTDLIAAPMTTGVELFAQLRSVQSPEALTFVLELPAGAKLVKQGRGAAVVREGEVLARALPPLAEDAEAKSVAVKMEVAGSALELSVSHRERDLAYPILLDPVFDEYSWSRAPQSPFVGWAPYKNPPTAPYTLSQVCLYQPCFAVDPPYRGLHIYAEAGALFPLAPTAGGYAYSVPHHPTTSAYIPSALGSAIHFARGLSPQAQPSLRIGTYAPAQGAYTDSEVYETDQSNRSAALTPAGSASKQLRFELFTTATGPIVLLDRRSAYLGAAQVALTDPDTPVIEAQNPFPAGWTERAQGQFAATARDGGLGVRSFIFNTAAGPTELAPTPLCHGTNQSPCAQRLDREVAYDTDELSEGATVAGLYAQDPVEHWAQTEAWSVKVDRSAPELELSGGLAPGSDHLGPDEYTLRVAARDGDADGEPIDWRSGVRSLEVRMDGALIHFETQSCEGSPWSCGLDFEHELNDAEREAYEAHGLRFEAIATDQLGHTHQRAWTAQEGGPQPVVERLQHDVTPERPAFEQDHPTDLDIDGWFSEAEVKTDAFARDANPNQGIDQIRLGLPTGQTLVRDIACPRDQCPDYAGATFIYDLTGIAEGSNLAGVRAFRPNGDFSRAKRFRIKVDRTAPLIDSFEATPVSNSGRRLVYELRVEAHDGDSADESPEALRAGIRSVEIQANGKRRFYRTQPCDEGSCAFEATFRYRPSREELEDQLVLSALVTDYAGNRAAEQLDLAPTDAPDLGDSESQRGLEQYFQYDSVETGQAALHTNLATGNAIWHKVPIVNPGRGLSSVVNLTYNSYDYPVSEQLGAGELEPEEAEALASNVLGSLGLGYDQAGPGFSLAISGLTRINEPLGGLVTARLDPTPGLEEVQDPTSIFLTDPDGTTHTFEQAAAGARVWEAPPGVDLHLREFSNTYTEPYNPQVQNPNAPLLHNQARRFAITRADGVTYYFDGIGFARSIEDRNGNEIKFRYKLVNPLTSERCDGPGELNLVVPTVCEPRLSEVIDAAGNDPEEDPPSAPDSRAIAIDYYDSADGRGLASNDWLKIEQITDHADRALGFEYGSGGRLARVIEAAGSADERASAFAYDDPGSVAIAPQIERITDPRQNATELTYTEPEIDPADLAALENAILALDLDDLADAPSLLDRRVESVTDRRQHRRRYLYEQGLEGLGQNVAHVIDAREVTTEYVFDETQRMVAMRECVEALVEACAEPEPTQRETIVDWSQDNRVLRLLQGADPELENAFESPELAITNYEYNENGALSALVDPIGRRTQLSYRDGPGNQISEAALVDDAAGAFVSDLTSIRRPSGAIWSFGVDERGNVLTETDPLGNARSYAYDAHGQVTEAIDEVENKTTFEAYDRNGLPTEIVDPKGNEPGAFADRHRWLYRYDEVGNLLQAIDPRGTSPGPLGVIPGYVLGWPDQPAPVDSPFTTTLSYDDLDRLVTETTPKDSAGSGTFAQRFIERSYAYDQNSNLTRSVDGTGAVFDSGYTEMDRIAFEQRPGLGPGGAPRTERAEYAYDAVEGLVEVTAPRGVATSAVEDDFTTRFVLDGVGRRVAAARQAGGGGSGGDLITSYAFDLRDNPIATIDPNQNREAARNPAQAALAAQNPIMPRRSASAYDRADQLIAEVEDPGGFGLRRQYSYDPNGNLIEEIGPRGFGGGADPADFATNYDYDQRDLMVAAVDPLGNVTRQTYDDAQRLVATERPNGAATALAGDFTVTYAYDANGYLIKRTIPLAAGQYEKTEPEQMDDLAVRYGRDQVGDPTSITDARGNSFANSFFDSGELKQTDRPSWWQADWGPARSAPDPARQYRSQPSGAMADTRVPVGGPTLSEAQGAAEAGEIGPTETPPGTAAGDFGAVSAEALPELLPPAGQTRFTYDDEMRLTSVTEANAPSGTNGAKRELRYDPQGRIIQKRLPYVGASEIVHDFAYDQNGNLAASTDGEGHQTSFAYDEFDRLVSEDAPGSLSTRDDPSADRELTDYRYDPNGNLERRLTPRFMDSERLAFEFGYDSVDRLVREANPANEDFTYGYDQASNVVSETTPRGNLSELDYDAAERLTRLREALATQAERTTRFAYDQNGNQTLEIAPGASDKQSGYRDRTTCTVYDGSDRAWKQTVGVEGIGEGAARTTLTEYDAQGNLRRVVNPRGVSGHCAEAEAHRPDTDPQGEITLVPGQPGPASDAARDATVAVYDRSGLLTERHLPWADNSPGGLEGGAADANGVNQQSQNQRRYVQEFDYSNRGLLETVTEPHPIGATESFATSYTHFPSGWFSSQSDPEITEGGFPPPQPIEGKVVSYAYDRRGNQTLWQTVGYRRSGLGQPPPDERRVRRSFHPSGLLATRTGLVSRSTTTEKRRYQYFYNQNRSLVETFDRLPDEIAGTALADGEKFRQVDLARDAAERELEIRETWDRGRDTEYRYDEDGNLTRRRVDGRFQEGAYQGGRLTTFEYDPLSRERRMAVTDRPDDPEGQSRDWTTSYHPSGEIDVFEKPNGTTERHFFRADGLIESIKRETESSDPDADKDATYTYDSNSNRTADERGTYAYNARDQLVLWDPEGEGEGNEPTSYVVNGSGQISEERSAELRSTYTYAGHRLTERKDDYSDPQILDATYKYRYDDFGNTTRIRGPGAGTSEPPPDITGACEGAANWTSPDTAYFCWDEFSRLNTSKGAQTNRSAVAVYVHDGLDRRDFRITQGNGSTELRREYSYVGMSELLARERRDQSEQKSASYDYSSQGRRLGQTTTGDDHSSRRYYATDAQGSVEALEAPDGTIASDETYAYDPYGALDDEGDPAADPEDDLSQRAQENPFRFQGHYYDTGIKSYDMQAREYSPEEGRFLTQDRFASAGADLQLQADPLTQNRYVFAGGNPVSNVEWDGHCYTPDACMREPDPKRSHRQTMRAMNTPGTPAASGGSGAVSSVAATLNQAAPAPPPKLDPITSGLLNALPGLQVGDDRLELESDVSRSIGRFEVDRLAAGLQSQAAGDWNFKGELSSISEGLGFGALSAGSAGGGLKQYERLAKAHLHREGHNIATRTATWRANAGPLSRLERASFGGIQQRIDDAKAGAARAGSLGRLGSLLRKAGPVGSVGAGVLDVAGGENPVRAGFEVAGGSALAATGVWVGTGCGPAAPVCSTVLGGTFGWAGGELGGGIYDIGDAIFGGS